MKIIITDHHLTEIVKRVVKEDQKNNLFKPRNLDRWDKWNKQQPEITIDGRLFKLNQYDSEGKKTGIRGNFNQKTLEQDYIRTKSFFKNTFDQLEVKQSDRNTNYMIGNEIYFQDPKNGCLWVSYPRIWSILEDQYSLSYGQVRGLIQIWMEMVYGLGPLTPLIKAYFYYSGGNDHEMTQS